jgi:hypothetical protein
MLAALVLNASAACTAAPEPPAPPQQVLALSLRYDRPTASLDRASARRIADRTLPQYAALEALRGLTFLRDVVAQGTKPDGDRADLALDVQGTLAVHAPCPGWSRARATDEAETGFIDLVIGVDGSRVQRAFTGRATGCRFSAQRGSERGKVTASMALELDLGRDLGLGEHVPSLLLRLYELSIDISRASSDARADLALATVGDELSLRIGGSHVLSTLIELGPLNLDTQGTCLLALRDDGRLTVRGRDGEWVCSGDGSEPCVFSD